VEIIRQCINRGENVLCLTASNAAVDNLAQMLIDADSTIPIVRLGHPARAHANLEEYTLSGLTDKHPQRILARELVRDALALLKDRSSERGRPTREQREEKQDKRREASAIFADVRRMEKQATESVMNHAKLICGTLTGFSREIDAEKKFDVLVVDEASQVLTPALLLGVLRANRVVLAGDHRQLPPTVLSRDALRGGLAHTAFESLMQSDDCSGCRHMLTVQHRMAEQLMSFSSKTYYEDQLRAHESVSQNNLSDLGLEPQAALELIDCSGAGLDETREQEQSSIENPGTAGLVAWKVRTFIRAGVKAYQIGVIAPYSAQVARLGIELSEEVEAGLEIDSVDGFQGREKEVIIFDAVRSNSNSEIGFLSDQRRLNVALTRAKRKLVVVADAASLSIDPNWSSFFDHAMEIGAYRSYFELNLDDL
jgi:predicted DNA helicase